MEPDYREDAVSESKPEAPKEVRRDDVLRVIHQVKNELKESVRANLRHVNPMIRGTALNFWERGFGEAVALFMAPPAAPNHEKSSPEANPASPDRPQFESLSDTEPTPQTP